MFKWKSLVTIQSQVKSKLAFTDFDVQHERKNNIKVYIIIITWQHL